MRIACSERTVCCVVVMALLCISFTCSQSAAATGPPHILNYQGTLTDDQGNPVNGQKTMSFRIYNSATAAPNQALWVSGDVVVPVVKGVFSVNLGEAPQAPIPSTLFLSNTRFLGVTVDGSELPDKKRLVSVPYALNAGGSEIPKGVIVMWSGLITEIPQGWALCDGTNGTPNLTDRFIAGAGSTFSAGSHQGITTINLSHIHATGNHTLTIDETPSHGHSIRVEGGRSNATDQGGNGAWNCPPYGGMTNNTSYLAETGGSGAHNHGNTDAAGNSAQDILPPYYALCFIMKL